LLLLALLTGLGGLLGVRLARTRGAVWLLVGLILVSLLYIFFLQDRLILARAIPWPGVFFLGNGLLVPIAAMLAGLAAPRLTWRWLLAPLLIGALYQAFGSLLGVPPPMDSPRVSRGVVMQTSEASCSAASAATLLLAAGVPATEAELSRLCFTRSSGTPMLGAFCSRSGWTAGSATTTRATSVSGAGPPASATPWFSSGFCPVARSTSATHRWAVRPGTKSLCRFSGTAREFSLLSSTRKQHDKRAGKPPSLLRRCSRVPSGCVAAAPKEPWLRYEALLPQLYGAIFLDYLSLICVGLFFRGITNASRSTARVAAGLWSPSIRR
jgi:hypothetical protein